MHRTGFMIELEHIEGNAGPTELRSDRRAQRNQVSTLLMLKFEVESYRTQEFSVCGRQRNRVHNNIIRYTKKHNFIIIQMINLGIF